jgi:hypothetical protein
MVGHQHIGMNGTFMPMCGFLQPIEIDLIVGDLTKQRFTIVPSLNHMERDTRGKKTR